ncbi:MAG: site-specific integrase [Terriglobia bacterium]
MPKQRKRDGVYWRADAKAWWVSYVDAQGERVREPAPDAQNHEEAATYREDKRRQVREQHNLKPGEVLMCRDSFADVAGRYLAYQTPRLKGRNSYDREAGIVGHLKEFFTGKLTDVTAAQVSDYVTMRLGKVGNSSVRKELVALKHLFRLVCGEWKLLPRFSNPCLDVTAPTVHDERTQHLSPEHFRRVLVAAPEPMKPIFALLTATGMRRSELLCCRWKYVDGARILLPTSKNDEPKEIHLNSFAQTVLASIPEGGPDDLLFPDVTPEAVSMAFHRVCKILSISDIRLHDLRHTFATWLRQQGVELDVIASQLGHRDLRMTKRYARIASSQVRQAVGGLDALLLPVADKPNLPALESATAKRQ